jgi:hypothetical protein
VFRISEQHAAAADRQFVQRGADEALTHLKLRSASFVFRLELFISQRRSPLLVRCALPPLDRFGLCVCQHVAESSQGPLLQLAA